MRRRRSISSRLEILVDTTFLLPALGVGVEEEAEEVIPLFRRFRVYYLEAGILEAIWKILKIADPETLKRVKIGIQAIRETYQIVSPPAEAYIEAAKIYELGHKDYIDALYYATARTSKLKLLTIDNEFIEFLASNNYDVENTIVTPRKLKTLLFKT